MLEDIVDYSVICENYGDLCDWCHNEECEFAVLETGNYLKERDK